MSYTFKPCLYWIEKINKSCCNARASNSNFCLIHKNKYTRLFDKPSECPICLEPFKQANPLIPCGHWIHLDCIYKSGKQECPICRQSVSLSKEQESRMVSHLHYTTDPFYEDDPARQDTSSPSSLFTHMSSFIEQILNENLDIRNAVMEELNSPNHSSMVLVCLSCQHVFVQSDYHVRCPMCRSPSLFVNISQTYRNAQQE